eukprot:3367452-Prymnesium_polylepis.1
MCCEGGGSPRTAGHAPGLSRRRRRGSRAAQGNVDRFENHAVRVAVCCGHIPRARASAGAGGGTT